MKNLKQYVGRNVNGVTFESRAYRDIVFASSMEDFIGIEGTITEYCEDNNTFRVEFISPYKNFWYYPAEVILPQLEREVKGYLFEDEKYRKVIAKLAEVDEVIISNTFFDGVHFYVGSFVYDTAVKYDLLDKCTPVYKDEVKLPIINGYQGVDMGDYLQYGCAKISKKWFEETENRYILTLTLNSGISINAEQMNEIRKYLDSKK